MSVNCFFSRLRIICVHTEWLLNFATTERTIQDNRSQTSSNRFQKSILRGLRIYSPYRQSFIHKCSQIPCQSRWKESTKYQLGLQTSSRLLFQRQTNDICWRKFVMGFLFAGRVTLMNIKSSYKRLDLVNYNYRLLKLFYVLELA